MRSDVRHTLGRLGPGDFITHEELDRLIGPLPDSLRELDVTLEPREVWRRALRRREVQGRSIWEAVA